MQILSVIAAYISDAQNHHLLGKPEKCKFWDYFQPIQIEKKNMEKIREMSFMHAFNSLGKLLER